MGRALYYLAAALVFAGAVAWFATAPKVADPSALEGLTADLERGRFVFTAGGCASCHAAPDARGEAKKVLAGGHAFETDFGTFYAPNISPDRDEGIGNWDASDLLTALRHGTSPDGRHYYPAFPYTSYTKMTDQDVVSLFSYLQTLPPSPEPSRAHEVGFPFNINRGLGAWKLLYLNEEWALNVGPGSDLVEARYLVEALSHCGECHTPRTPIGGLDKKRWLGGAPNPSGRGNIPNITPGKLRWSETEILDYLVTGFTPDFDSVGGSMVDVVEGLSKISEEKVVGIVAYLKATKAVE